MEAKVILFISIVISMSIIVTAQLQVGEEQGGVILNPPEVIAIIDNASINSSGSAIFWRLDGTNYESLTSDWNMFGFDLRNVSVLEGNEDGLLIVQAGASMRPTGDIILTGGATDMQSRAIDFQTGLSTDSIFADFNLFDGGIVWSTTGGQDLIINTPGSPRAGMYFNVSSGDAGHFEFNGIIDEFIFEDDINIENLSEHFIGNGTKLEGVCLQNGTNCDGVSVDLTNVAFLNNTQTFVGNNTFNGSVTFFDGDGDNEVIVNLSTAIAQLLFIWNNDEFSIETENSKLMLFNEPNQANDFKVLQTFSKQAQDVSEFVVTKAGNAHASYFIRSLSIVGNSTTTPTPFNCSTYADHIDCNTDQTGADLFVIDDVEINDSLYVDGLIFGNGSQLTDICLSNGTNCDGVSGFDNTNIAYLNNTQSFIAVNNFSANTIFDGNITSSDGAIRITGGNNITFYDETFEGVSCLNWEDNIASARASICKTSIARLEIRGGTTEFLATTLLLGTGLETAVGFTYQTTGGIGVFDYTGTTDRFEMEGDLAFGGIEQSAILFAPLIAPTRNLTWSSILGTDFKWTIPDLWLDIPLINATNINVTGDVCIDGTTLCLSNVNRTTIEHFNLTFQNGSLLSITLESDATISAVEYNVFDENNYAAFSYTNNTLWRNVTYHTGSGEFEVLIGGNWKINPLVYTRIASGSTETDMIIDVNGVSVFDHTVARVHTSVDPELLEANIVVSLSAHDNITISIDGIAAVASQDGTTMNLELMDTANDRSGGGGGLDSFLSISIANSNCQQRQGDFLNPFNLSVCGGTIVDYINNTAPVGIDLNLTTGNFQFDNTGTYKFEYFANVDIDDTNLVDVEFFKNDVEIYTTTFSFLEASLGNCADYSDRIATIIFMQDFDAGDNFTLSSAGGQTSCVGPTVDLRFEDGTTLNIIQIA